LEEIIPEQVDAAIPRSHTPPTSAYGDGSFFSCLSIASDSGFSADGFTAGRNLRNKSFDHAFTVCQSRRQDSLSVETEHHLHGILDWREAI
jgi:hypothetical protein